MRGAQALGDLGDAPTERVAEPALRSNNDCGVLAVAMMVSANLSCGIAT